MSVKLIDFQLAQQELQRALSEMRNGSFVTVGIHEDTCNHPDAGISNAQLGALLNFGDDMNTLNGMSAPIPPRPWLIPGVESGTLDIIDTLKSGFESGAPLNQTLEQVGAVAAGAAQVYMTELRDPPNAAYTIEQKGSDNPLIDTGALRASVTYKVTPSKPEEGL